MRADLSEDAYPLATMGSCTLMRAACAEVVGATEGLSGTIPATMEDGRLCGTRSSESARSCASRNWGHGAEPDEARRVFDGYVEAGGNFIDTLAGSSCRLICAENP